MRTVCRCTVLLEENFRKLQQQYVGEAGEPITVELQINSIYHAPNITATDQRL